MATGKLVPEIGGKVLEKEAVNYGISSPLGKWKIVTLLMNLGEQPFQSWRHTDALFKGIITEAQKDQPSLEEDFDAFPRYQLDKIISKKSFPYIGVILLLVVYIVFVGPILYIIFKKRGQRDRLWIAIPVTALVCLVGLYGMGMGTRETQPIMNMISIIEYEENMDQLYVESTMAIFNHTQKAMVISWGQEDNIDLSSMGSNDYRNNLKDKKRVVGKMTLGTSSSYENYNPAVWEASYLRGEKIIPLPGQIETMSAKVILEEESVKIEVTNPTPLDLNYIFVVYNQSIYWVGALKAGETAVSEEGASQELYYVFEQQLGNDRHKYSNQAALEILEQKYRRSTREGHVPTDYDTILLCGINKDPVGYALEANKQEIKTYNQNIVQMKGTVQHNPGDEVRMPHGMIQPTIRWNQAMKGYVEIRDDYKDGITLTASSIASFGL